MRHAVFTALIISIWLLSGCKTAGVFLVKESEFNKAMDAAFPLPQYTLVGSGVSGGGTSMEFSRTYKPLDESALVDFNFSAWDAMIAPLETFSGIGNGGSPGSYWRKKWDNDKRHITVEAVVLKNGSVRAVYREILR